MKMEEWSGWAEREREPLHLPSKGAHGVTFLWPWVPAMSVYLPKCHHIRGFAIASSKSSLAKIYLFFSQNTKQCLDRWSEGYCSSISHFNSLFTLSLSLSSFSLHTINRLLSLSLSLSQTWFRQSRQNYLRLINLAV